MRIFILVIPFHVVLHKVVVVVFNDLTAEAAAAALEATLINSEADLLQRYSVICPS